MADTTDDPDAPDTEHCVDIQGVIADILDFDARGSTLQWAVVEHGSSQSIQIAEDAMSLSMMQLLTTQVAPSQRN